MAPKTEVYSTHFEDKGEKKNKGESRREVVHCGLGTYQKRKSKNQNSSNNTRYSSTILYIINLISILIMPLGYTSAPTSTPREAGRVTRAGIERDR